MPKMTWIMVGVGRGEAFYLTLSVSISAQKFIETTFIIVEKTIIICFINTITINSNKGILR